MEIAKLRLEAFMPHVMKVLGNMRNESRRKKFLMECMGKAPIIDELINNRDIAEEDDTEGRTLAFIDFQLAIFISLAALEQEELKKQG